MHGFPLDDDFDDDVLDDFDWGLEIEVEDDDASLGDVANDDWDDLTPY